MKDLPRRKTGFKLAIHMSRSTEMTISIFLRLACAVAIVVCITAQRTSVLAQQRGGTAETEKVQPVNSGPNPYRVIRDWAHLTLEKRPWGGSNGVAIDRDGKSVWATDRCSPGTTRAASAPKRTRSTILTIQGRRSGASAAGCSFGRMASMSIARVTYG